LEEAEVVFPSTTVHEDTKIYLILIFFKPIHFFFFFFFERKIHPLQTYYYNKRYKGLRKRPYGPCVAEIRDSFHSVEDAALLLWGHKMKINFSVTGTQMADFWVRDEGRVSVQRHAARPTMSSMSSTMESFSGPRVVVVGPPPRWSEPVPPVHPALPDECCSDFDSLVDDNNERNSMSSISATPSSSISGMRNG